VQKRRKEHLKKYLDDFEVQATAMLEKMRDVQDELTRSGVTIDGYEQFRKAHKAYFPLCFELYRIFLSVPATSVAIESLFRFMAHVDSARRRSLHPDRLGRIALSNARARATERKPQKTVSWP
jgi:hypothetical protein